MDFIKENLRISIYSIKANPLRTVLTVLIIGIGIMALTGILTATEAIKSSINGEFTRMGANTFSIRNRTLNARMGKRRERKKNFTRITFKEAKEFKGRYKFPALVSISVRLTGAATVKYKSEKTNPNIPVNGCDENYIATSGLDIAKGRNFTEYEIRKGRFVTIIGSELANTLFKKQNPIGKVINAEGVKFKIIGVLKSKGSSMGFGDDKAVLIPVTNARQYSQTSERSFKIDVLPSSKIPIDIAVSEAEGIFRNVRNLRPEDGINFSVVKSDNLANMLLENIGYVTFAAMAIGFITLFGAAVGLMNIMLVSVSERTREIGVRKALGATSAIIKQQFLFESVFIGQMGGLLGIILGVLVGNFVSLIIGSSFIIPWLWILFGVILCFVVGILSGLLPAVKASKLEPIIALRYE